LGALALAVGGGRRARGGGRRARGGGRRAHGGGDAQAGETRDQSGPSLLCGRAPVVAGHVGAENGEGGDPCATSRGQLYGRSRRWLAAVRESTSPSVVGGGRRRRLHGVRRPLPRWAAASAGRPAAASAGRPVGSRQVLGKMGKWGRKDTGVRVWGGLRASNSSLRVWTQPS
jgi:hypothetical protein